MPGYGTKVSTWVYNNPSATAILTALLAVAVIILLALTISYHKKWAAHLAPFDTSAWKYGSVNDQLGVGSGGSLTPAQLSVYMPQLGGVRSELSRMMMPKKHGSRAKMPLGRSGHRGANYYRAHRYDNLQGSRFGDSATGADSSTPTFQPTTAPGNPLDPDTGYEGDEGNSWMFDPSACPSSGTFDPITGVMTVDTQTIGNVWDPDAIAEAQALASVGSYVNDPSGDEMAFQAAISSAYDSNSASDSLSDAQLAALMASGNSP